MLVPLKRPPTKREASAHAKVGEQPRASMLIAPDRLPMSMTGLRPITSLHRPHAKDVRNWAAVIPAARRPVNLQKKPSTDDASH